MHISKTSPSGARPDYTYDLLVFIGRFQFPHQGHLEVIKQALSHAKRVLILIGSANAPRSHRNPFTYQERADMLRMIVDLEQRGRIYTRPLEDSAYNDEQWLLNAQRQVQYCCVEIESEGPTDQVETIGLIGHAKDHTSYYLKLFPQWGSVPVENFLGLSATPMREEFFSARCDAWMGDASQDKTVPDGVLDFLKKFRTAAEYEEIRAEYEFVQKYREQWKDSPYPPTFVTVDACVVQSGHVLLVKRKEAPGKGLWALPGGFINQKETVVDAMLRELREETKIAVPAPVLKGSIVTSHVFDDPNRSARGRTITHAFLIHLKPEETLPKIKRRRPDADPMGLPVVEGSDDAEKAQWWPLSHINRSLLHEDHYDILNHLAAQI